MNKNIRVLTLKQIKEYIETNKQDDIDWLEEDQSRLINELINAKQNYRRGHQMSTQYNFGQVQRFFQRFKNPKNIDQIIYHAMKEAVEVIQEQCAGKSCLNKQCSNQQCEDHKINWQHYIPTKSIKIKHLKIKKSPNSQIKQINSTQCVQYHQKQAPIQNYKKLANFTPIQHKNYEGIYKIAKKPLTRVQKQKEFYFFLINTLDYIGDPIPKKQQSD